MKKSTRRHAITAALGAVGLSSLANGRDAAVKPAKTEADRLNSPVDIAELTKINIEFSRDLLAALRRHGPINAELRADLLSKIAEMTHALDSEADA